MYKKSALKLFSAVGALALGFTSALQPAVGETGTWRPYGNTNPITSSESTWKCASTKPIATNVFSQVCIIRSANGQSIQGAVIVQNRNDYLYSAEAQVTVIDNINNETWYCPSSGVGANSWSVCFGKTYPQPYSAYSYGYTNNVWLEYTGSL